MVEEVRLIKTEAEIWKFLQKKRNSGKGQLSSKISMEEWKTHFQTLLQGTEREPSQGIVRRIEIEGEIAEIKREEMEEVLKRLKKNKAPGEDGIKNEAWIHANEKVKEKLHEIINLIWQGKGFPTAWRNGQILPLHKKGSREEAQNYRGITLLNTSYKIYAMILENKLKQETEEKGILPETQAGFRKNRSGIDNIYILNQIIEKELTNKGGTVYCLFVDFKAAFDLINREKLWEYLKRKEIDENLRLRLMEIYEVTKNVIKVGEKNSSEFYTEKGLRQGCPLSPTLFAIYISDIEEVLRKGQDGGIVIERQKIHYLAYADDIVLLAKSGPELKQMMLRLEKYTDKRDLVLNPQKTKVMVFKKGRRKKEEDTETWDWKGEKIEAVRDFKYLGYVFQRNNGREEHMSDVAKKATKAMKCVWSLCMRYFRDDLKKQEFLFTCLVESIMLYAAEIWGWQECPKLEEVQRKFFRWTLGIPWHVPNYVIQEELKRSKIREKGAKRAIRYEEKIRVGNVEILRDCTKVFDKEPEQETETRWARDRRRYLEGNGFGKEYVKEKMSKGFHEEVWRRAEEIVGQENRKRIESSKNWNAYAEKITPDRPFYLRVPTKGLREIFRERVWGGKEDEL